MPLSNDVDWASLGVFINISSATPWLAANETAGGLQTREHIDWFMLISNQTADVQHVTISLPSLKATYDYLR